MRLTVNKLDLENSQQPSYVIGKYANPYISERVILANLTKLSENWELQRLLKENYLTRVKK